MTLVELLVVITMTLVVSAAAMTMLTAATQTETRDQSWAQAVSAAQSGLARMVHDLRQATSFLLVAPNKIEFTLVVNGTTYNVLYDCTASDSRGSPYTRCARTQAVAPAIPASAGGSAGSLDIQHVMNGSISTFCNSTGSGPSGSVFFVTNPSIANTDGSTLACDEAYENLIGPQLKTPTFVQVLIKVPASGNRTSGGMTHATVLQSGAYLPNSDAGA
jgi:type II secretory pathway pseudopilin PulG